MRRVTKDKRVLFHERDEEGACASCGRRHVHQDDCVQLSAPERAAHFPDEPPPPYAGGLQS
jgi:hypothetical protein